MIPLRWACLFSFLFSLGLGLTGCGSGTTQSNQEIAAKQIPQDRADRIEKLKANAAARQKKGRKAQPKPATAAPVVK